MRNSGRPQFSISRIQHDDKGRIIEAHTKHYYGKPKDDSVVWCERLFRLKDPRT